MKFTTAAVLLVLLSTGCATAIISEAGHTQRKDMAHIEGDYRITAGLPVTLTLRSVDGHALKFWQHAADVDGGQHQLLVDCHVAAADKLSRHALNVTVYAGERYGFAVEASAHAGCEQVRFVPRN